MTDCYRNVELQASRARIDPQQTVAEHKTCRSLEVAGEIRCSLSQLVAHRRGWPELNRRPHRH